MTTPDQGVEWGWLAGHGAAQLALSNGTAGGAGTSHGKQSSAQVSWIARAWRLGAAFNYNTAAQAGNRSAGAIFAGLKTGPISWLAEADLIDGRSPVDTAGR